MLGEHLAHCERFFESHQWHVYSAVLPNSYRHRGRTFLDRDLYLPKCFHRVLLDVVTCVQGRRLEVVDRGGFVAVRIEDMGFRVGRPLPVSAGPSQALSSDARAAATVPRDP